MKQIENRRLRNPGTGRNAPQTGQPSVNAVTSVSSVCPTVARSRRINRAMSVSAFATAANTCRPPAAVSTLPTRTFRWRSPSSRLRTKVEFQVERDCRYSGGWLFRRRIAKLLPDLQRMAAQRLRTLPSVDR
jgi:hypothetical protein